MTLFLLPLTMFIFLVLARMVAQRGGAWRLRILVETVVTPITTEAHIISELGPPFSMISASDGAIRFD